MSHEKNLLDTQGLPVDFLDFVTYIPVGACKFLLNDTYTLVYGNQALFELLGYTKEQFQLELHNEIVRTFPNKERDSILKQLQECSQSGLAAFQIEHRLCKRSGESIWVLVSGSFTTQGDAPAVYGIVLDVTERKQMEEQLRINEERFRLALAQTDSTIFDYDITTKVMIHADKAAEKYGLSYETKNVPAILVENKTIHPDCAEDFLEMYRLIRSGEPTASCVIRARTTEKRYVWQKITMTAIYDHNGTAVRAVGILEDIDEQTRREAHLLEQSQKDILTGLYNKGTTESKIRILLNEEDASGALFMIDLDAFKEVNDQYGHLFGDFVLTESAHRMAGFFRQKDVIGRIGGDEFLVYLEGAHGEDTILHKANELCSSFKEPFTHNGISTMVTCTVGIALHMAAGKSFEALYQNADIALYQAKRNGKNQYVLYSEGMENMAEQLPYHSEIDAPSLPDE